MDNKFIINEGKSPFVEYRGQKFACYAVHTSVVTKDDRLEDIIDTFLTPLVRHGDIVFMSEKMVACTEGRAYRIADIKAGFLASFLSKFVTRSPYGCGLAKPETMQCAINEVGAARILAAAFIGAIGKLLGKKGWFYRAAGYRAASIDGPCDYTLPPYNKYVVLSPSDPDDTAMKVSLQLGGNTVLIIDANDFGCAILGTSVKSLDRAMYAELLRQNPLGQSCQCTPLGILRPVESNC